MKQFFPKRIRLVQMATMLIVAINISLMFCKLSYSAPGDTITLNLATPTNPPSFIMDEEQGFWTGTYSNQYNFIEFDFFKFTHIPGGWGGTDVGGGMSYWDGFTYCNSGDNNNYGEGGNSSGWLPYQWGNMAGGGIKSDNNGVPIKDENGNIIVEKEIPYLVAYWGYYMEMFNGGEPCLQVRFKDGNSYEAVGVYINNHPWPYYGNIYGDSFARRFGEGDYFKLYIHGFNENFEDIGNPVEHTLAEFVNGQLIQSPDWEWVDLGSLGPVHGFYFTMVTTDSDPIVGPNTAVYFCMDKLQVKVPGEQLALARPSSLNVLVSETTIDFSWEHNANGLNVEGYNLYLNDILISSVTEKNYQFTGLSPLYSYIITVEAYGGNLVSEKATITVSTIDETQPSTPKITNGIATLTTITINWEPSTDNVGVAAYNIYLNGVRKKKINDTSFTLTGLSHATTYTVEVDAVDETGNKSERGSATITTLDEIPPTMPSNIAAQTGETSVILSWTASTDNVAVVGYRIYNGNQLLGISASTNFTVSNLETATEYTFSVEAFDAAGNRSDTTSVTVSTLTTSIDTPHMNTFSVYPNPFANYVVVDIAIKGQAEIYDITGQVAMKVYLNKGRNQIDTSHLLSGVYVLKTEKGIFKLRK